jgi:hypothetical protein
MGETGLIYFLIPLSYVVMLLVLLLLAVIVQFFRKTRFLGSYFLLSAVLSIPGFIAGILLCAIYSHWQYDVVGNPSFNNWNPVLQMAIVQAPFGIVMGFVMLGLAAGAYLVRRSRLRRFGMFPRK